MKIIIQLAEKVFIRRTVWIERTRLAIISNPDIQKACPWSLSNAKMLLPSIQAKFPEAKIVTLK